MELALRPPKLPPPDIASPSGDGPNLLPKLPLLLLAALPGTGESVSGESRETCHLRPRWLLTVGDLAS